MKYIFSVLSHWITTLMIFSNNKEILVLQSLKFTVLCSTSLSFFEGKTLHFRKCLKTLIQVEAKLDIQCFPESAVCTEKVSLVRRDQKESFSLWTVRAFPQCGKDTAVQTFAHGHLNTLENPNTGKWRINWIKSMLCYWLTREKR